MKDKLFGNIMEGEESMKKFISVIVSAVLGATGTATVFAQTSIPDNISNSLRHCCINITDNTDMTIPFAVNKKLISDVIEPIAFPDISDNYLLIDLPMISILSNDIALDDIFYSGITATEEEENVVTVPFSEIEKRTADLTNEQRKANGLKELILDRKLTDAAEYKARDMVNNGLSHQGSYGTLGSLLSMHNVTYTIAGENIAMGHQSPEDVVQAWMNSEGHRENILNANYRRIGIGYVKANGTTYWVMELTD